MAARRAQRVFVEGEFKALASSTLNAVADAILAENLASQDEIHSALASLAEFTDDPETIIGDPRIFKVWSRRASAQT